jgi:hypothetical protein
MGRAIIDPLKRLGDQYSTFLLGGEAAAAGARIEQDVEIAKAALAALDL